MTTSLCTFTQIIELCILMCTLFLTTWYSNTVDARIQGFKALGTVRKTSFPVQ